MTAPSSPPSPPIPDYLAKAAEALNAIGFVAIAFVHDGFGIGMQPLRSQGITVRVADGDPRIAWDTRSVEVTPFVAGVHNNRAQVTSPRGFEYSPGNDGEVQLCWRADSEAEVLEFVECFAHPMGAHNKIEGPLSRPGKPAASKSPRP